MFRVNVWGFKSGFRVLCKGTLFRFRNLGLVRVFRDSGFGVDGFWGLGSARLLRRRLDPAAAPEASPKPQRFIHRTPLSNP